MPEHGVPEHHRISGSHTSSYITSGLSSINTLLGWGGGGATAAAGVVVRVVVATMFDLP